MLLPDRQAAHANVLLSEVAYDAVNRLFLQTEPRGLPVLMPQSLSRAITDTRARAYKRFAATLESAREAPRGRAASNGVAARGRVQLHQGPGEGSTYGSG